MCSFFCGFYVLQHRQQCVVVVHQQALVAMAAALPIAPIEGPATRGIEALEFAGGVAGQHGVEDAARVLHAAELVERLDGVIGPAAGRAAVFVELEAVAAVVEQRFAGGFGLVVLVERNRPS